jgi:hypothetical protein
MTDTATPNPADVQRASQARPRSQTVLTAVGPVEIDVPP